MHKHSQSQIFFRTLIFPDECLSNAKKDVMPYRLLQLSVLSVTQRTRYSSGMT